MKEYHKIHTVFKRNPATKHKTLIEGDYSLPEFAYLAKNEWWFTEKIDGTNIRIMRDRDGNLTFGGKTDAAQIPAPLVNKLKEIFTIEKFADFTGSDVCLYGEGYGVGIQKGGGNYIADGVGFILFDVWFGGWWLERANVEDIAARLSIPVVPLIGRGTMQDAVELARKGFPSVIGNCTAEGIVMRPSVELFNRGGYRIVSKIKHKDFTV